MLNPMPSEKTKQLLVGLNKIYKKPNRFQEPITIPGTNMYPPKSPKLDKIHELPKSYENAKRHKDEDGNEFIYIDRVYGSIWQNKQELVQKDGTVYQGKLYRKRRLMKTKNSLGEKTNYYSSCTVTADGRWFDNGGLPIEAPKNLEPEKKKTEEEIEEEKRLKAEKEARILANLK
tara:strand:- start:1253 stop:1777 length:525 start_codon:yes stop_codon:yes gene_type:complete